MSAACSKHKDVGTVIIYAGVNDTSSCQAEVFKKHFGLLLDTDKRTEARTIFSGPLPTYRRGSKVFSRLYTQHCWLQGWCKNNDISYISN